MNTSNGTEGSKGTGPGADDRAGSGGIRSLRELPREIAPSRDLWPSISAQLDSRAVAGDSDASGPRRLFGPTGRRLPSWMAAAAVIAALAVGMWLGRSVLPSGGGAQTQVSSTTVASNTPATTAPGSTGANGSDTSLANGAPTATPSTSPTSGAAPNDSAQPQFVSTFVVDPRYKMNREAMVRDLESRLKTLPPDTQEKVSASLITIRSSMKDIEAALGRDPANALLQELLINTYQDEMRVLTAVNEASAAGRGT